MVIPLSVLSGHVLWGSNAVRYIFVDESGTSDNEDVVLVAALIVHADDQLMRAEAAIREVNAGAPTEIREDFCFHAKDIMNRKEWREFWSLTARIEFMKRMMSLPRRLGIPISFAFIRKGLATKEVGPAERDIADSLRTSVADYRHFRCFETTLCEADQFMRDHAELSEVASVVAENVGHLQGPFRQVPKVIKRQGGRLYPPGSLKPSEADKARGYIKQGEELRISRIRDTVLFAGKDDEPLLQIADACAYGLRQYFEGKDFGDQFIDAIKGAPYAPSDWDGLFNHATLKWKLRTHA